MCYNFHKEGINMKTVIMNTNDFNERNQGIGLPYSEDVSILGESVRIGNVTVPNRLVCQAMEGCDGNADGTPAELTERKYLRLARGGAGLIWYEATALMPWSRANPRQLMINKDNIDAFKRLNDKIKEEGMKKNGYAPLVIMQSTHSGRYSKPEGIPAPIIAYNNPIFEGDKPIDKSRIITDEELDQLKEALIGSAELAAAAGFDGVDIKSCHRYLLSELLSAYTREGRYGGCYENRTRMLREAVAGAIQVAPKDFIVSSRLNVYDGFPYPYGFGVKEGEGITPDFTEAKRLVGELADLGVGILNISMGNPYFNPHVNRPYAKGGYEAPEDPMVGVHRMLEGISEIGKHERRVKLISSGISYLGTAAPNVTAAYIKDGGFAFAGFGREILAYPDFANDILHEGGLKSAQCCLACSKCTEVMRAGGMAGCVVRDREVYVPIYKQYCGK